MAKIVQMKSGSGEEQYPVTSAEAVGMPDGSGNLNDYLKKKESQKVIMTEEEYEALPEKNEDTLYYLTEE